MGKGILGCFLMDYKTDEIYMINRKCKKVSFEIEERMITKI
ncbi:hypothetical protein pah_c010o065 [Parachlamydia acanthamoebae str. Hall's coccus]|jgi:hypothetical protein|nr:hypothetical protein pah_c010o065 [Parachlamydia acanthamoebae str. Hall's coccus]